MVERIELDQTVDFALRINFMTKNIETVLNKSAVSVSFQVRFQSIDKSIFIV